MLGEILDLGFEAIELSHGIRVSLLEGIFEAVKTKGVNITGLHNFCPLPVEIMGSDPDCYEFTSHRESERRRAVKLTLQTLENARRLGAGYVVLHLGHVPMGNTTDTLLEMAEAGKLFSRRYVDHKLRAVRRREKLSASYLQRVRECLEPVTAKAKELGIKLAIENRQSYEQIPSEREFPVLLESLEGAHYWHDFGHAQIKENLGFLDHHQWLRSMRDKLLGCHFHDTAWPARDHLAPLHGAIDWKNLIPLLPESCLCVWEMGPRRSKEEIIEARRRWETAFGK